MGVKCEIASETVGQKAPLPKIGKWPKPVLSFLEAPLGTWALQTIKFHFSICWDDRRRIEKGQTGTTQIRWMWQWVSAWLSQGSLEKPQLLWSGEFSDKKSE